RGLRRTPNRTEPRDRSAQSPGQARLDAAGCGQQADRLESDARIQASRAPPPEPARTSRTGRPSALRRRNAELMRAQDKTAPLPTNPRSSAGVFLRAAIRSLR